MPSTSGAREPLGETKLPIALMSDDPAQ